MTAYDDLPDANSVVVSFRLNDTDPREKRAIEYLALQRAQGLKKRAIIVDALLAAADNDRRMQQLESMQRQALDILQKLESGAITVSHNDAGPAGEALDETFKKGLIKLARPVVKYQDGE